MATAVDRISEQIVKLSREAQYELVQRLPILLDLPENVNELIQKLKDDDEQVQRRAAEALKAIGTPAVKPLMTASKDKNSDISLGAATALQKILEKSGDRVMAQDLLNRGHTLLVKAAISWAKSHGYAVKPLPDSGWILEP